jgi:hypothetical protein
MEAKVLRPTFVTWILLVFGWLTCGPLLYAQFVVLIQPHGQRAKELMMGKDQDWRDGTHFRSAVALAWADWLFFAPLFAVATIGVLLGRTWGYALFGAAGAVQLYVNLYLWFLERAYVYPAVGPVAYYTYIWGNFVYWGAASLAYAVLRLAGVTF